MFNEAQKFYAAKGICLAQDLTGYLGFGYVVSTPELFTLFKPVDSKGARPPARQWINFGIGADSWYVKFLIKSDNLPWSEVFSFLPYPLPNIIFERYRQPGILPVSKSYNLQRLKQVIQ